ncbi:MAG: dTDP-4-dehydrorhamnose 3,5-epimerase [Ignavibacteria bacterium]|nr:dTDP-4-dehydrorhamnose 3,5-epimerase [Ignavibacteria bacterium]
MKIIDVKQLEIPDVKVVRFGRFSDHRGFFAEPYRKSDFQNHPDLNCMKGIEFLQVNESYSKAGVMRGLHFQWNPFMGKLVRTVYGRMIDMFLDIRKGSPTYGKAAMYDMPDSPEFDYCDWIWVPPGFAHGNYFPEESKIEYFCSGEYSPGCEAGISPISSDIDWSLCNDELKNIFDKIISNEPLMTDKDKNGFSVEGWKNDSRSDIFQYSN